MTIEKALPKDAEDIAAIYRSHIGDEGCTWDESYPDIGFVRDDIAENSLYKAELGEEIVAAAFLGDFEEIEHPDCIDASIKRLGEFSRVAVKKGYERRGIAEQLLRFLLEEADRRGYDGLTLLVGVHNRRAAALYEKIGFKRCGETYLYDTHWYCYQYKV